MPVRLLPGLVALFAVLGAAAPAAAAGKVDLVVLENGDRVTCEIKGLDRGRLTLGTDAFDTIHVYWSRIARLASPREFEVEQSGGQRFYGTLVELPERRVRVEAGGAGIDLPLEDVVRITPIEAGFWQRTDGHIDVGFGFNKASLETRWTLNADARHRTRRYDGKLVLASQSTRREDAEPLQRNTVSLVGNRFVGTRWSAIAVGQVQQNQELSLDLRTVFGAGVGHYVAQSNRTTLQVYSGIAYTREQFSDAAAQNRAEAVAGGNWDWFSARDNDIDLTTAVITFYGLNGAARARVESQNAFRIEFLKDFYFSVNGYSSYDSHPPEGRETTDIGLSLALGWSF